MLKFRTLSIENVGRISNLELEFTDGVNLICGPNGIGKTTILESFGNTIAWYSSNILRKRVGTDRGLVRLKIDTGGGSQILSRVVKEFTPDKGEVPGNSKNDCKSLIVVKTNRTFGYEALPSITRDPTDQSRARRLASTGIEFSDIKSWFVNRFVFSARPENLAIEQMVNLDLAMQAFTLLDPAISFSRVIPASLDIMVATPDGEIYFEYLSSGFKSCLSLILGLIKEIEYRFTSPFVPAREFDGVVVVDELDLHLHPEWQPKLIHLIKAVFPKAQFIAATHSPHMIQAAESSEIIALETDAGGSVRRRKLPVGEYGFQGWTVEEILLDVMGMNDTRSVQYRELQREFDDAITRDDEAAARAAFEKLDHFLHPNNVQRKLFKLQLGTVVEDKK